MKNTFFKILQIHHKTINQMVTKFFLRPTALSFTTITTHSLSPLTTTTKLCLLSISTTTIKAQSSLHYGPSLQKGQNPSRSTPESAKTLLQTRNEHPQEEEKVGDFSIDEEDFTRVYDISALRVPAKDCYALESRLRGHLLNWPRVRNIARVPGDDVEGDMVSLVGQSGNVVGGGGGGDEEEDARIHSLNRRLFGRAEGDGEAMSDVLYREKLGKEFNARGFVKFRTLARISRPKKRKRKRKEGKEKEEEGKLRKGDGSGSSVVEVVVDEEDGEGERGEEWNGLLGDEFMRRRKWRGPTRLLLLDERYADKGVEELPPAIQVVLQEAMKENSPSTFELVKCKLTLFYNYWQMNEILEAMLPHNMIVPSAFEIVGHIAHLNLRDEHLPYKKLVAKVVLDKNKPKIQTVVNKIDAIHNNYRTMPLEVLAGNRSLVTMVVENGLRFHVDLATVYWNSRLGTERLRLLNGFTNYDVVCDVFAGVGPIAIPAVRIVKYVYANDLNPYAVDYMERNSVLNKLERKIEIFNMDARRFINAMFASEKGRYITQVVMNLPNNAVDYLDTFKGILNGKGKGENHSLPMIHVYGFSKARDPEFDFHERIRIALTEEAVDVEMRRVRLVAPGKWMLCASFRLPVSVAYAKNVVNM